MKNFKLLALAVVIATLSSTITCAQDNSYTDIKAWQVTSDMEVTFFEKLDDGETNEWTLKTRGSAVIGSSLPFMWGTPSYQGIPTAETAYNGKGTAEFHYRAVRPHLNASFPGGSKDCSFSGDIPYSATIVAMPGQPVSAGAGPHILKQAKCTNKGDFEGTDVEMSISVPELCHEAGLPQAKTRQITHTATCEKNGVRMTYRFNAVPSSSSRH